VLARGKRWERCFSLEITMNEWIVFVVIFQTEVDIFRSSLSRIYDDKPVVIPLLLQVTSEFRFLGLPLAFLYFSNLFLAQLCMNSLKFDQLRVISP
jgi:hypothetical protein